MSKFSYNLVWAARPELSGGRKLSIDGVVDSWKSFNIFAAVRSCIAIELGLKNIKLFLETYRYALLSEFVDTSILLFLASDSEIKEINIQKTHTLQLSIFTCYRL